MSLYGHRDPVLVSRIDVYHTAQTRQHSERVTGTGISETQPTVAV